MEYREVIAYLVTPDSVARKIVNEILLTIGFRQIIPGTKFEDVEKAVEDSNADIIIVSGEFKDGDIHKLVKNVRNGKIGANPFVPFLTFVSQPTREMVANVSESGSDDLISYPMSPNQLEERIAALVDNRKPFVVTSDYIGPDRRLASERREGGQEVPLIDTPNTLRARVRKDVSRNDLERQIVKASKTVKGQRVERVVGQLDWLINRILSGFSWAEGGKLDKEVADLIVNLTNSAHELEFSFRGPENKNLRRLCGPLHAVSARVQTHGAQSNQRDLDLLRTLNNAFKHILENKDDENYVMRVQKMVEAK